MRCVWFILGLFFIASNAFAQKILYLTDDFPHYTSVPLIHHVTSLVDQNHEVFIFSKNISPGIAAEKIHPDMKKYQLNKRVYFEKLPKDIALFDIVICKNLSIANDYLFIKKQYPHIVYISHVYAQDVTGHQFRRRKVRNVLFKMVDYFLPVSWYAEYKLSVLGCSQKKISVLYEPVDCKKSSFTMFVPYLKNTVCVLIDGYGVNVESLEILLKLAKIKLQNFKVKYTVLCQEANSLRQKEERKRITDNYSVSFVYNLTRKQLLRLLKKSHLLICLLTTKMDGAQRDIPLLAKEAMAKGVFVIAPRYSSIQELIIRSETGFLFPERDYRLLVQQMKKAIQGFRRWPSKLFRAREIIQEKHSKKVIAAQLNTIIDDLINIK